MNNEFLEKLIDNEKEWRRWIVKKVDRIEREQVRLRIKSSLWGAASGGVVTLILLVLAYLKRVV